MIVENDNSGGFYDKAELRFLDRDLTLTGEHRS